MIVMILWDNLSDLYRRRTTSWRPEMANKSGYFQGSETREPIRGVQGWCVGSCQWRAKCAKTESW